MAEQILPPLKQAASPEGLEGEGGGSKTLC